MGFKLAGSLSPAAIEKYMQRCLVCQLVKMHSTRGKTQFSDPGPSFFIHAGEMKVFHKALCFDSVD